MLHPGIAWFSTVLPFNTQLQLNTIISWTSEELLLFSRVEGCNGRSLPARNPGRLCDIYGKLSVLRSIIWKEDSLKAVNTREHGEGIL